MLRTQFALMRVAGITPIALLPVIAIGIALTGISVCSAFLMAGVFARVVGERATGVAPVLGLLVGIAACVLVRPAFVLLREVCINRLGLAYKTRLRDAVLARFEDVGPAGLGDARTGAAQSALTDGVENLEPFYGRYLPQAAITLCTTVVLGTALVVIDPVVGGVLLVCGGAVVWLPRLWDRVLSARGGDHWEAFEALNAEFIDSMCGMVVLKANNAAQQRQRRLDAAAADLLARTMGQLRLSLVESGLSGFMQLAGPVVGAAVGIVRLSSGAIAPAELFLVLLLSAEMFKPFRDLSAHWHAGYLGTFAAESLLRFLRLPVRRPRPSAAGAQAELESSSGAPAPIVLSDAHYRHPGADEGLSGVSWSVPAGSTAALVGASGAGKSTLLDLVTGLLEPRTGDVRLLGRGPAGADPRVGVVSQHPAYFGETLAEYLCFGRPGRDPRHPAERERIRRVLAAVSLPLEPERRLGEYGGALSGGQRQRAAIARALLPLPELLILDEATSALDARTERAVLAGIRELCPGITILMVNHRMATVAACDEVAVLAAGRLVEHGPPRRLAAAGGAYAALQRSAADDEPSWGDAAPGEAGHAPVVAPEAPAGSQKREEADA